MAPVANKTASTLRFAVCLEVAKRNFNVLLLQCRVVMLTHSRVILCGVVLCGLSPCFCAATPSHYM